MKKKVESIIEHNFDIIDKHIQDEANRKFNNFIEKNNVNLERELMHKLRSCIEEEVREFLYNKIEHRVIIEELYPEKLKEEALNGLPQWIVKL